MNKFSNPATVTIAAFVLADESLINSIVKFKITVMADIESMAEQIRREISYRISEFGGYSCYGVLSDIKDVKWIEIAKAIKEGK